MPTDTPVLLIIFRRPDTTAAVLEVLREVEPRRLYVAADGPVPGDAAMEQACADTRELVAAAVTWPCQLQWCCAPTNLGCRLGVSAALSWFFAREPEGIILEDDVVPHPSFFEYCTALLDRYRDDTRVGAITGLNQLPGPSRDGASYFFSRYNQCWGWASWRRAWRFYDAGLDHWPSFRDQGWLVDVGGASFSAYFRRQLERVRCGDCNTWDYIWSFSLWRQGMVTCVPAVNLVANIGMGHAAATHTLSRPSRLDGRTRGPTQASALPLPMQHPDQLVVDRLWDRAMFRRHHNPHAAMRLLARGRRWLGGEH